MVGCPTWAQKRAKTTKKICIFSPFLSLHRLGQPNGPISSATLMPFTSIYPTNPRTNPWNFHKKYWELAILKNSFFFQSAILIFFCLIPMKISQSYLAIKDRSKFWWLTWFSAINHPDKTFLSRVYSEILNSCRAYGISGCGVVKAGIQN